MKSFASTLSTTDFPLLIPTQTQHPTARLVLRNDVGQVVQQWLVKQTKCTLGSAASCSIRCELAGIAPYHALLVVGARQIFIRALAPKLTRNGRQFNEVLLTDDDSHFEIAGHRFELSRNTKGSSGEAVSDAADRQRLKFTLARPFALSSRKTTDSLPSHNDSESTSKSLPAAPSGSEAQWVAQLVQAAIQPLECQLQNLLEPITQLQSDSRKQQRLRRKRLAAKRRGDLPSGPNQEVNEAILQQLQHHSEAQFAKHVEEITAKHSSAARFLGDKIENINDQLAALEQIIADERRSEPTITEPVDLQPQFDLQAKSIEQLQAGLEAVSSAVQNLQTAQNQQLAALEQIIAGERLSDFPNTEQADHQPQLDLQAKSIEQLQAGLVTVSSAMQELQTAQNQQLSALEQVIADQRQAELTRTEPAVPQPQLDLQSQSIEQLQAGLVAVSSAMQNLQTSQNQLSADNQGWKHEIQEQLGELTLVIENLATRVSEVQANAVLLLSQRSTESSEVLAPEIQVAKVHSATDFEGSPVADEPAIEVVDELWTLGSQAEAVCDEALAQASDENVAELDTAPIPAEPNLVSAEHVEAAEEARAESNIADGEPNTAIATTDADEVDGYDRNAAAMLLHEFESLQNNAAPASQDAFKDGRQDVAEAFRGSEVEPAESAEEMDAESSRAIDEPGLDVEADTNPEEFEWNEAGPSRTANAFDEQASSINESSTFVDESNPMAGGTDTELEGANSAELVGDTNDLDEDLQEAACDGQASSSDWGDVASSATDEAWFKEEGWSSEDAWSRQEPCPNEPSSSPEDSFAPEDSWSEEIELPEQAESSVESEQYSRNENERADWEATQTSDGTPEPEEEQAEAQEQPVALSQTHKELPSWWRDDENEESHGDDERAVAYGPDGQPFDFEAQSWEPELSDSADTDTAPTASAPEFSLPESLNEEVDQATLPAQDEFQDPEFAGLDTLRAYLTEPESENSFDAERSDRDSTQQPTAVAETNAYWDDADRVAEPAADSIVHAAEDSLPLATDSAEYQESEGSGVEALDQNETPNKFFGTQLADAAWEHGDLRQGSEVETAVDETTASAADGSSQDVELQSEFPIDTANTNLANVESPSSRPEDEATNHEQAVEPETVHASQSEPQSPSEEDDSVEEYMRKLLARMRGVPADQVELPRPAAAKPKPAAETSATPEPEQPQVKETEPASSAPLTAPLTVEQTEPFDPEKYMPRSMAPERSQDFALMRDLANSSARTAIHKSARQRHLSSILLKVAVATIGFTVGSVLIAINGLNVNIGLVATVASFLVAAIWGYDAVVSLKPLLQAGLVLQPAAQDDEGEGEEKPE